MKYVTTLLLPAFFLPVTLFAQGGKKTNSATTQSATVKTDQKSGATGSETKTENKTISTESAEDPLLKTKRLDAEEVYPREDLNIGPEFLMETRKPLDFKLKPFLKLGFPVFPMLQYFEEAGMDLYSGQYYLGGGIHFPSPLGAGSGSLKLEGFLSSYASGEGTGLSKISNGHLIGTTGLKCVGGYASHLFYPFSFDYLFFGLGGGASYQIWTVNYNQNTVFVDGSVKKLENGSYSGMAPMAVITLGVDVPAYKNVRFNFETDYQLYFFKSQLGGSLIFALSVAMLL